MEVTKAETLQVPPLSHASDEFFDPAHMTMVPIRGKGHSLGFWYHTGFRSRPGMSPLDTSSDNRTGFLYLVFVLFRFFLGFWCWTV